MTCVANKIIEGNQMTVVWHVDDLKVSHKDPQQIDKFINFLKTKYENESGKVKVTRGKKHKYLGMMLDYTIEGSVKIDMEDYINKIIDKFPEEVEKVTRTLTSEHLF